MRCLFIIFAALLAALTAAAQTTNVVSGAPTNSLPAASTNQPAVTPPALPAPPVLPAPTPPTKVAPGLDWKTFSTPQLQLRDSWAAPAPKTPPQRVPLGLSLAAGAALNSGNSDAQLYNLSVDFVRKGERHEVRLAGTLNYGTDQGAATVDNAKGEAAYHYRFSERWYGIIEGTAFRDTIADVNYRIIGSPGIGVYVFKDRTVAIGLEAGPAYLAEEKGDVSDNRVLLRCAERGEWQLLPTSRIWEAVEFLPPVDRTSEYLINSEAGAEAALSTLFNIRVVVKNVYDNAPAPGRKSSDVSITGALVIKL